MVGERFSYDWERAEEEDEVNITLYGVRNPSSKAASKLVPKGRFLHVLFINRVMPRSGAKDNVSKMDGFSLFHLLSLMKIDLNKFIFKYLSKTVKLYNMVSYPYGMFIIKLLTDKVFN